MKKVLLAAILVLMIGAFTACNDDTITINVFNWGDFIDPETITMFTEETGIRVVYTTYASNEEMYTRVVYGGADFDVLVPSDYMIERMIEEGRLSRINWDNIPNRSYIDPKFWDLAFDPNNEYSVPYFWGTFGILYNTTMVDQVVDSWAILWDKQFAGQIFMYDIARDTFAVAQKLLGYSINSTDMGELERARDLLIEQGPLVRAFQGDQNKDSMINREGALATVYSGCAMWSISQNPELHYVVPNEGTQLFFDSFVIPSTSQNQEAAEAFINFMTRPDIALMNTLYVGFSTTNAGAFAMLPVEKQNDPIYWPSDYIVAKSEVFVDLGDFREHLERAFAEVLLSIR